MQLRFDGDVKQVEAGCVDAEQLLAPFLLDQGSAARVVVRLALDGEEVPGEHLSDLSQIALVDAEEVEVDTVSVREVALQGLASANDYAEQVGKALRGTADQLRSDRPEVASEQFADAVDGLLVLFFALDAAASHLGAVAEPVAGIAARVQPWLDAVLEAHEGSDWVRVADYLEYEIVPVLDDVPDLISGIRSAGGLA